MSLLVTFVCDLKAIGIDELIVEQPGEGRHFAEQLEETPERGWIGAVTRHNLAAESY